MNEVILDRFIQLVASTTGLHLCSSNRQALSQKITQRMQSLQISAAEVYYQLLETKTSKSVQEWQHLVQDITTPESYFFRDEGQFKLLSDRLLPELIERNKTSKTLRIWSAGCSTGEEPYSIAILLNELIPDLHNWTIFILGTDINQAALEKAKLGIYSPWSFRLVNPQRYQHYFQPLKTEWQLLPKIRQMVTFQKENLVADLSPSKIGVLNSIDLIICRNVFVYFAAPAIAAVLNKFCQTLKPGGYLLTGHTELWGQNLSQFKLKSNVFCESIVYQYVADIEKSTLSLKGGGESLLPKPGKPPPSLTKTYSQTPLAYPRSAQAGTFAPPRLQGGKPKSSNAASTTKLNKSPTAIQALYSQATVLFQNKAYTEAINQALNIIQLQPTHFDACYLVAQIYANIGQYALAIQYTQQAISLEPLTIKPYYLLARIAEEQGNLEKAKACLKQIIYLEPKAVQAYLELSSLYTKEGNTIKAKKMHTVALGLLK